ncbi:MAG: type II secretion system protein [Desulfamplus sp.]|nr:type II secretion system protein [Desulfamplus sp.]
MMLILKVGKLNKSQELGFTLIELIVVLAVMGTVLFITLPKFRALNFVDDNQRQLNILLNTIKELKKKSIADSRDYILHLDAAKSLMWVTSENRLPEMASQTKLKQMESTEKEKHDATSLPEPFYITGVEIYGLPDQKSQEEYLIRFSKKGYCDMTLIHLKERGTGNSLTVVIEPFLSDAEIKIEYISFDRCS